MARACLLLFLKRWHLDCQYLHARLVALLTFRERKMGFISESLEPKDFADAMVPYLEDKDLAKTVSRYNAKYAKDHFMASSVAKQIENTLKEYIK